ncbi:DNA-directed RNA polymerase II core subunit [Coemansia sp. RSA 989]|nr:DNA-directed RNA polymerase [Coemansia mojavensis]KAJ1739082.1 DNA-directed RNA polymerase II core subunit [Coemansia sp. RSA 1086]KAJ1750084.1 DNA-directed RNA polymerase II core subunit [Coemansia sp. RSA 1821]KAJ1864337.1 DNA-directed RNA polymerase II core subunit [Coemansia sp. RSA 989]KAJ1874308.1 DNA-directed RNA polymerase II core subunit [Coemansia sp. RSA 990]KAJ2629223.1 DNA-directed RNA polymerase II core subunit [Coemansia sp. RSA 1290]KAJ2649501.1 DNA-directed RNA polymerase 
MNAPERHEMFTLPEGVRKIELLKDSKMANCIQFNIQREDHTIANILRYKLLQHPQVLFAAYRMPHPLEYYVELKVQTTSRTTPVDVMKEAIESLMLEYGNIRSAFDNELLRVDASGDLGRRGAGFGAFGALDPVNAEFGVAGDMGRGPRSDDVDIDF